MHQLRANFEKTVGEDRPGGAGSCKPIWGSPTVLLAHRVRKGSYSAFRPRQPDSPAANVYHKGAPDAKRIDQPVESMLRVPRLTHALIKQSTDMCEGVPGGAGSCKPNWGSPTIALAHRVRNGSTAASMATIRL